MSAGQIWRRDDRLTWVEIQTAAVEGSGWRLMIPLVGVGDAPDAPPLVCTVGHRRARVHLLTGVPADRLGAPYGQLDTTETALLQEAACALLRDAGDGPPAG